MNYSHFDFSQKGIIRKAGIVAFVSAIGETLSYPFDRIKTREIAKRKFTSGSILKEQFQIYADIINAEKQSGLIYGLRSAIDKGVAYNLIRFFAFDFLLGRPLDPYTPISDFALYLSAFGAQSIGFLLAQPSHIFKIKIQCEPLGNDYTKYESYSEKYRKISQFHKGKPTILMGTGFKSGIVLQNALAASEIFFFFKILRYFYEQTNIKSDYFNVCASALITSNVATLLTHPLDFLNTRYCIEGLKGQISPSFMNYVKQAMKEEMGIFTIYKGLVPSLIKNSITTTITFVLWNFFSTHRRHEALYNYYSRKQEQKQNVFEFSKGFEMTGGRNSLRD